MSKGNKTYSREFRAEAVKMVLEQGLVQEEAAKRLGVPKGTLSGWMAAIKARKRGCGTRCPHGDGARSGKRPAAQRSGRSQDEARHPKKSDGFKESSMELYIPYEYCPKLIAGLRF